MARACSSPTLRFGTFEVDRDARELRKGGFKIRLTGKPWELLLMLLHRAPEPVTREEIRARLWSADTFVDFEGGMNSAVRRIREALGDSSENPRFVETLPRQGYRFIAPVIVGPSRVPEPVGESNCAVSPETIDATLQPQKGAHKSSSGRYRTVAAVALVFALILGAIVVLRIQRSISGPRASIRALAVLPFQDVSSSVREPWFAEGLTEALITDLARIPQLRVIARTSVLRFKEVQKPTAEIARQLGVDAVIEGAVSRSGGRIRVSARLISAPSDLNIWSDTEEREFGDALALQTELARAIAHRIQAQAPGIASDQAKTHRVRGASELESYLRGRYAWNRRTEEDLLKSIKDFEDALARAPNFAEAHAGIADSYVVLAILGMRAPQGAYARAERAARTALEFDSSLGEAHTALADIEKTYHHNWTGADREYRQALSLAPGSATAHQWYADFLSVVGRQAEAVAEMRRAQELDPLSPMTNAFAGFILARAGKLDQAVAELQNVTRLYPTFALGHWFLGFGYQERKEWESARAEFVRALELSPHNPRILGSLGRLYGQIGDRANARRVLLELIRMSARTPVTAYNEAQVHAGLGQQMETVTCLEKAYEERAAQLIYVREDSSFDFIRTLPRYQDLVKRIWLAQ